MSSDIRSFRDPSERVQGCVTEQGTTLEVAPFADFDEQFRSASCAIETVDDIGTADARIPQRRMRDLREGTMIVVMIVLGMREHDRRRERVPLKQRPETCDAFPVAPDVTIGEPEKPHPLTRDAKRLGRAPSLFPLTEATDSSASSVAMTTVT
jgi:hypothetical protein